MLTPFTWPLYALQSSSRFDDNNKNRRWDYTLSWTNHGAHPRNPSWVASRMMARHYNLNWDGVSYMVAVSMLPNRDRAWFLCYNWCLVLGSWTRVSMSISPVSPQMKEDEFAQQIPSTMMKDNLCILHMVYIPLSLTIWGEPIFTGPVSTVDTKGDILDSGQRTASYLPRSTQTFSDNISTHFLALRGQRLPFLRWSSLDITRPVSLWCRLHPISTALPHIFNFTLLMVQTLSQHHPILAVRQQSQYPKPNTSHVGPSIFCWQTSANFCRSTNQSSSRLEMWLSWVVMPRWNQLWAHVVDLRKHWLTSTKFLSVSSA